ncbi:type I-E CRISPR-associated protein Cas5/CasD [Mycolicibacterium phlei]|jgi:CRISPR system Cascade subunit CasD|uniref:type I-E CRISPR-associated protein Cas5/CasD n=2 Tax=Mycolicibacterium phlei TaxID=1771 RepID=UPI00058E3BE3|nr:type I-E CRISPR-associated protein Cas5/CasD [Mycolicibacterium phlei]
MSVVAMRLAGPLQSWGSASRFTRRGTERFPTKSGVLGLVAAALGLRRDEPVGQLATLRFGVRADQPGTLLRDFQTAHKPERQKGGEVKWRAMPLSHRYYVADAVFLACLEGDAGFIADIDAAVRSPAFPLYLGRRSCPPAGPVALGRFDDDLEAVLATHRWLAAASVQRRHRAGHVLLETARDADESDDVADFIRDVPVSFDPNYRQYGWRRVVHGWVEVTNPTWAGQAEHDPMTVLEG